MQSHSKIDELLAQQKAEQEKQKEQIENLKLCSKELFSTTNGKYFLKFLMKMCFWAEQDTNINPDVLLYKKARRDIWAIVRNIIPKETLAQIEIYEE